METSRLNVKMDVVIKALGIRLAVPAIGMPGGEAPGSDGDFMRRLLGHCRF